MSEEYFIAVSPMLSVIGGSKDIASTPSGKKHKDGTLKYFYKCSLDEKYKKFYVNAEDCPRHTKEFLEKQKAILSKLAYAQEYQAVFTDELKRLFPEELIRKICTIQRLKVMLDGKYYLGCDIAGFGEDDCTYELFQKFDDGTIMQRESVVEKRNYTTDTTRRILELNRVYNKIKKIGIDDGGVGFGVFSELMNTSETKRRTIALNNASRAIDKEGKRSKKILKEEMYINLQILMEQDKIKLLDDDEIKDSLSTIQHDEGKIFGSNSHIAEGIIRGAWLAEKDKSLNIWAR